MFSCLIVVGVIVFIANAKIQMWSVKFILDSVIVELTNDPNKRQVCADENIIVLYHFDC